jgi:hypothetical protein
MNNFLIPKLCRPSPQPSPLSFPNFEADLSTQRRVQVRAARLGNSRTGTTGDGASTSPSTLRFETNRDSSGLSMGSVEAGEGLSMGSVEASDGQPINTVEVGDGSSSMGSVDASDGQPTNTVEAGDGSSSMGRVESGDTGCGAASAALAASALAFDLVVMECVFIF